MMSVCVGANNEGDEEEHGWQERGPQEEEERHASSGAVASDAAREAAFPQGEIHVHSEGRTASA